MEMLGIKPRSTDYTFGITARIPSSPFYTDQPNPLSVYLPALPTHQVEPTFED